MENKHSKLEISRPPPPRYSEYPVTGMGNIRKIICISSNVKNQYIVCLLKSVNGDILAESKIPIISLVRQFVHPTSHYGRPVTFPKLA